MNRYPVWKYLILVVAVLVGLLYALPNLYGEAPAVQIAAGKTAVKVDDSLVPRVQQLLADAKIQADYVRFEGTTIRARFADIDTQIKAQDALNAGLNHDHDSPEYIVALNLLPRSPNWMAGVHAVPMYLGLDLRGGVHFLLQVDLNDALARKAESATGDVRLRLREKSLHAGVTREGSKVVVRVRDAAALRGIEGLLDDVAPDMLWTPTTDAEGTLLTGSLKPPALLKVQSDAIKQNMTTLGNRLAGLGTSEPVIQQQGLDRIVVEVPGIQDPARAKDLIGRTATLQVHLVDTSAEAQAAAAGGPVPFGSDRFFSRTGVPTIVKREVVFSGQELDSADATFDSQDQQPAVTLNLNSKGARIISDVSSRNIGKPMAIVLFEKGKGEVISVATIQSELHDRFNIHGGMTVQGAADLALLLRSGALAAKMDFVEESAIGPSLGADNIDKGLHSVAGGFAAILVFMCAYYLLFGLISTLSLAVNLLLLIAVLSQIQTTLTLPGIAAIALTLGMAIDSNVLVNERIREELRNGSAPQTAIAAGYERAWATILDSNITTLIAGLSLLAFGSGPVRGFAIVHCLGILTSMFSAVFFSRGLVNLWYGRRKKLKSVAIGQVWRPDGQAPAGLPLPDEDGAPAPKTGAAG